MQKRIEEYGKIVEITGFRNVRIKDAKKFSKALKDKLPPDCEVQLFDANLVATWEHLYFAVLNALMNLKSKRGISRSIAVETVLYASAQRQIQKAISFIGLKPNSKNAAFVVISNDAETSATALQTAAELLGAKSDETVLELSTFKVSRIRKAFNVTNAELDAASARGANFQRALVDLILERVALLSTRL